MTKLNSLEKIIITLKAAIDAPAARIRAQFAVNVEDESRFYEEAIRKNSTSLVSSYRYLKKHYTELYYEIRKNS